MTEKEIVEAYNRATEAANAASEAVAKYFQPLLAAATSGDEMDAIILFRMPDCVERAFAMDQRRQRFGPMPTRTGLEHNALKTRFPAPVEESPSVVSTTIGYAYSPRENVNSKGGNHVVLLQPLAFGRFRREKHDALCKPFKKFWGLNVVAAGDTRKVTCTRCIELAVRFAIPLPNTTA